MQLILLAILTLIFGITSYGRCNKMRLNPAIKPLDEPTKYQIEWLLQDSEPQEIGSILEKYGLYLYYSSKDIVVSNYLYSFDRTYPFVSSLFIMMPICLTWVEAYELDHLRLLSIAAVWLSFLLGWFIAKKFIFRVYNEDDCSPSERTPFPSEGGYVALEQFLDQEHRRYYHLVNYREEEMKRQKKVISYCNSVRISVITLAIAVGLIIR